MWAMAALRHSISHLDKTAAEPFYRQVYDRVRGAIFGGVLEPGQKIPSARALASELGLARGTVDTAYALLAAEGLIESRGQAGTIVAPDIELLAPASRGTQRADRSRRITFRPDSILPFQMGLPALDAFPRKIWARLGARRVRGMQASSMAHPSIYGLDALRTEIAAYLHVSRGIRCSPSQIFVTSGYRHTLELICQTLLDPDDMVWVENPGFPPTRELLAYLRMRAIPVSVDGEGIEVGEGKARAPDARAAIVTPAHQSPSSVSMSLSRRLALLEWAARNDSWIVEDDYDGEYRYVSRPIPALKSLDRDDRVLYAGTFSKVLFPSLRLAYLVVPQSQVGRFEEIGYAFAGGSPELTQGIASDFIQEGHFARHIQRMRKLYAERRTLTASGLMKVLAGKVRIDLQPGGMHLVVHLLGDQSDRELASRMHEAGLYAEAMTDWTFDGDGPAALLLNFTNVESEATAASLAERIRRLI